MLQIDFEAFAEVIEQDSNLMHSVMCTSQPELIYWTEATLDVIQAVLNLRKKGIEAAYTIDAGPNVHVITRKASIDTLKRILEGMSGVLRIVVAPAGSGAVLIEKP
jgi:diphosphomevalonate decarboxylase